MTSEERTVIEEIVQALAESGYEGFYFIGINTECFYNNDGGFEGLTSGDSVKCYSYDTIRREFSK